jgi:hypothetical protein
MSYREASAFIRTTGMAKPSQYALFFAGPFDIIPPQASKRLTINCEECFFPSKSIFTADVRHYGNGYKYPYSQEYSNEITMIFRVGADMYEKRVFEEWMDKIIDRKTMNHEYYDNYTTQIGIAQIQDQAPTKDGESDSVFGVFENLKDRILEGIDRQIPEVDIFKNKKDNYQAPRIGSENIVYQCILEKAFPIGIMELPLGHGSTDTYHRMGVTFSFKKWTSIPELGNGDIKSQSIRNSELIDGGLETTQKQGINGQIINVISRGVEQYGPAFRKFRGNISF